MKFGVGQTIGRIEDDNLLRGEGRYSDDFAPGEGLRVAFLRSSYAHARILSLDTSKAELTDGVNLVATQASLDADSVGEIHCQFCPTLLSGKKMQLVSKPAMIRETTRSAGEIVAMVVAESQEAADTAVESIDVTYEVLSPVMDVYDSIKDGAPQLYEQYENNIAFEWGVGDEDATRSIIEKSIASGEKIIDVDVVNSRVVINSLETRPIIAVPDMQKNTLEIWCGTQGVVGIADQIAKALSMDISSVRVRTGDVGGSFGFKIFLHPEQICVAWAARRLGKMVRWQQSRSDGFISDLQGRDNRSRATVAFRKDGRITAFKASVYANLGAWLSNFSTYIPTKSGSKSLTSIYDIQVASLRVYGVMTNTPAVDAYRGAGRPEANYLIERVMDHISNNLGLDRVEVRRINMIQPEQIPYKMVSGGIIDSGDIPALFKSAIRNADVSNFENRRKLSADRGKLRGIGFGLYLEQCGEGYDEGIEVEFQSDGRILVTAAQQCNGQGHKTTLVQILSSKLGYDASLIDVKQGDSFLVPRGTTGGARMTVILGSSVSEAADIIISSAIRHVANIMDCGEEKVDFADGFFSVTGSNQAISIEEVVKKVAIEHFPHPLNCKHSYTPAGGTYPYGCHIVELEVDPITCEVEILCYNVTDDFGNVINPKTLLGQIHGGVAQGVGQALFENVVYDKSGQLLSGSLMDYAIPRADHLPAINVELRSTPCKNNPLGVKGAGEAGAIGAPQAVISALCDALGVTHIDMPATNLAIYKILHKNL